MGADRELSRVCAVPAEEPDRITFRRDRMNEDKTRTSSLTSTSASSAALSAASSAASSAALSASASTAAATMAGGGGESGDAGV